MSVIGMLIQDDALPASLIPKTRRPSRESVSLMSVPEEAFVPRRLLRQLLAEMPTEWLGTTFRNTNLLGRRSFALGLRELLEAKAEDPDSTITRGELLDLGEAEDYLRVASNVSTTLEAIIAFERGIDPERVFSFASKTMPIIAVCLTAGSEMVHLFHGSDEPRLTQQQLKQLAQLGGRLSCHAGPPPPERPDNGIVLCTEATQVPAYTIDGTVGDSLLIVSAGSRVDPQKILLIRKRLATPATTPNAIAQLRRLAGLPVYAHMPPSATELNGLHEHLQTMSGAAVDAACPPALFTAGLPALASLWSAVALGGGADVLMCSTAYGGSSQVTDLLEVQSAGASAAKLRKHTFHIQGGTPVNGAIGDALRRLLKGARAAEARAYPVCEESRSVAGRAATAAATAAGPRPPCTAALLPTTIVFVELPSNPDMKVSDLAQLARQLRTFEEAARTRVVLLVDTTFAPASRALRLLQEAAPALPCVCFVSLSKAVSRGRTTAGALIANHTAAARALVGTAAELGGMLDVGAKPEQLSVLVANHRGVEDRCWWAWCVAAEVGAALSSAVEKHSGKPMALAFVTPEQAAAGFSSSTFSFNLPPPVGASAAQAAALAQNFVDALTSPQPSRVRRRLWEPSLFKPCVSFGQDNGIVYCTVPATSTQGAVKAEDKAKQAVGGVQLVRLSFPPALDTTAAIRVLEGAVAAIYAQ